MTMLVILAVFMLLNVFLTHDENATLVTLCNYNYHVKVLIDKVLIDNWSNLVRLYERHQNYEKKLN